MAKQPLSSGRRLAETRTAKVVFIQLFKFTFIDYDAVSNIEAFIDEGS